MHHIIYQASQNNIVNFFGIYEALFVGFLTFISILVVAMLYRSEGLTTDLRSIKKDSRNILQRIKEKDKNGLGPAIYEPALLDPKELRAKIESNLLLLSQSDRQEANRIVYLLNIVFNIEIITKRTFKNLLWECVAIIIASLFLMFIYKFIGILANTIFVAALIVFAIYILTYSLYNFFKNINIFLQ